jgi:putative DNA primase/helicase
MTQTSEAPELIFRAKLDFNQERIDLHTRYLALVDSGKHTSSTIYQYILMYNDTLEYPLSAEEFSNYSDSLFKEVTPSQEVQEVDALTTYRQAIAEKDTKKLYQCVENLALLKRLSPIKYVETKEEIKKAFGKDISWRDLNGVIAYAERKQTLAEAGTKPDVADIAQRWAMTYRDTWRYDETTQCWRMWNGEYWEEVEEKGSILDQYTIAALQEASIPVNSTNAMNTFLRVAQSHCKRKFIPAPDKINFANGTLDVATGKLMRYDQEDNLTYCLPYNYNPQKKHPNITRYLEETIPDAHGRQALMAHLGLALMGDTYMHHAVLLIGPTRAGKTTILALANALCGGNDPWRFAGPSLFSRELEGKRSRSAWNRQRIVCIDELPSEALRDEELFKTMTGHGGVEERGIGKDENINNRWSPKLLMSTNDTPHYKDTSSAIKQRAIIIECPNGPRPDSQQDKKLFPQKLLPELDAFSATCIQLATLALDRGYYPRSDKMKALLDRIASEGNPLKAFLAERCILDRKEKTLAASIYTTYRDYCLENGNKPLARNTLSSALRDMYNGVTTGWMRVDGNPARCYLGIRLRKDADSEPTEDIYQSTPLLSDSVNVVNDPSTITNGIVDGIDQPLEHAQDILSTMSTINQQYSPIENVVIHSENANVSIEEDKSPKTSLTSLTPSIDQPLARSQPVNGHQKASLTIVDSSLTVATKGKRDERGFLVTCKIEGCTRPNTTGGNAMCHEHRLAHK